MSLITLKVHIKTLAAESKILRDAERKSVFVPRGTVTDPEGGNTPKRETNRQLRARRELVFTRMVKEYGIHKATKYLTRANQRVAYLAAYRKGNLRPRSREAQLAYAYLRGYLYKEVETVKLDRNGKRLNKPNLTNVAQIVHMHADEDTVRVPKHIDDVVEDLLFWARDAKGRSKDSVKKPAKVVAA